MTSQRLLYAMDVLLYCQGKIDATDALIEHIIESNAGDIPYTTLNGDDSTVDEWMADRELTPEDFGLTADEIAAAEDELRIAKAERQS